MRTILVVSGVMLVFWTASLSIIFYFLLGSFGRLQHYLTNERIKQAILQIGQMAEEKSRLVKDNAVWDDTYQFLQGKNPDFMKANYAADVDTTGQNVILIFDRNQELVSAVTLRDKTSHFAAPPGLDINAVANSALLKSEEGTGLIASEEGVVLMASHTILPSNGDGPVLGWMVFGTYLDTDALERITRLVNGSTCKEVAAFAQPIPVDQSSRGVILPSTMGDVLALVPNGIGDNLVCTARLIFPSLAGKGQISFTIEVKERVFRTAYVIWQKLIWCAVAGGLALIVIAVTIFEVMVLRPLTKLENEIALVTSSHKSLLRVPAKGAAEFKRVAESVNHLLDSERDAIRTLDQQKTLLSNILDAALEAVVAFEPIYRDGKIVDLRIVVFNRSAERIVRRKASDAVGRPYSEVFPGAASTGLTDRVFRMIETRTSETFEYQGSHHLDNRWFEISAAPWLDGILMTFVDITDRKVREKQLQESMAEIERFNRAMIGREDRVVQLKEEINALHVKQGLAPPYLNFNDET